MSFPICKVRGTPKFDILPVAKITDYPLEKRDYKPFAQCRIALDEQALYLQLWAFEAKPEPGSCLQAALALHADRAPTLLTLRADGSTSLSLAGQAVEGGRFTVHPFCGDDLQGPYWGATATLPLTLLQEAGQPLLHPGAVVAGNFYKTCRGQRPHYGSFTPVPDWEAPYAPAALGELVVTNF